MWSVVFLDDQVFCELREQPDDIRAKFERIVDLIKLRGLEQMREPYVKHLQGRIWEMRMIGRDGIARALYVTASGERRACGRVAGIHEEDAKDAASRNCAGLKEGGESFMTRRMIPAEEAFAEWRKDPNYVREYDALEEEFALAAALIGARARAELTQGQLAKRMGTTQAVIARLESGRTMPSTRTLERLAKATGHKLKISFEPAPELAKAKKRKAA